MAQGNKTSLFRSCVGVFQGGGCRAAAFVGAYDEAVRRGVSFIEVAGTSAGSIIASLIGAGATPSDLRELLEELDFRKFLMKPEQKNRRGLWGAIAGTLSPQIASIFFDRGMYSSAQIATWMDTALARLLPNEEQPITFRTLPVPTYVISTDLTRSSVKIWSNTSTPDELVRDAVRASCSIPLFFQPLDDRFVDGGVLSNLPAFVFADGEQSRRPLATRTLAFVLVADTDSPAERSSLNYILSLLNAIVDGSQALQLRLQPDVVVIKIPTGKVKATDFEQMNPSLTRTLIQNGTKAASSFFDRELGEAILRRSYDPACYGDDEIYTRVTQGLEIPLRRVVISEDNTSWVYSLFPTILCLRMKGVPIKAVLPFLVDDRPEEAYRRQLLRELGATVVELEKRSALPVRAYVLHAEDDAATTAIVRLEGRSPLQEAAAIQYRGFLDLSAIRAITAQIDNIAVIGSSDDRQTGLPRLEAGEQELLAQRLRMVRQYSLRGVEITLESVPKDRFEALTNYVREFKIRQMEHLIGYYQSGGLKLFQPAVVRLGSGVTSIMTPPVTEEVGDKLVVIQGTTRVYHCFNQGISPIQCVVVRGVRDALPSRPIEFRRVGVVGRAVPVHERYKGMDYASFRSIEATVRPVQTSAVAARA